VAIAAPRGHAKSTAITHSYLLAMLCFREAQYVVIVSDTEAQSILFLADIKRELSQNEHLIDFFGIEDISRWTKESETDIIVRFKDGHEARVVAKGSNQKIRGYKWNNKRPDLLICDDMENDELVMNKERREKLLKWFLSTLLPMLSKEGIVRMVGTILHEDSLLNSFMPREQDKNTVVDGLCTYSLKPGGWLSYLWKAHPSINNFSKILWPDRHSEKELRAIRDMYIEKGQPEAYAQEYLNQPLDETTAQFRKSDFKELRTEDKEKRVNFYIGLDLAVTESTTADYSCFVVGAVTEDNDLQIRHVIRERMDSEKAVETIINLQRLYDPMLFCMEKGQITNSVLPFLRQRMGETGVFVNMELTTSNTDKVQRVQSFRARARAGKVRVDQEADWWPDFLDELVGFPRKKKDDQVDACAQLGLALNKMVEAVSQEEIDEDEYREALEEAGLSVQGRNIYTGY
jgi:predicted phage terminase large subunit-like protein